MTKPRAVKVNADQHARAKEFVMKRARISLTTAAIAAVVQLAAGQALAADAAINQTAPEQMPLSHSVAVCKLVVLDFSVVARGGDYGV